MRRIVLLALILSTITLPQSYTALATTDAATVLNSLEIKGRAPKTGYSRAQFPHWSDLDRNLYFQP